MPSHYDVALRWANRMINNRLCGLNVYAEEKTIFSFGNHFPIATFVNKNLVLFNKDTYSKSTSKHQGHVINAICRVQKVNELLEVLYCDTEKIKSYLRDPNGVVVVEKTIEFSEEDFFERLKVFAKEKYGLRAFYKDKLEEHFTEQKRKEETTYNKNFLGLLTLEEESEYGTYKIVMCFKKKGSKVLIKRCYDENEEGIKHGFYYGYDVKQKELVEYLNKNKILEQTVDQKIIDRILAEATAEKI